MTSEALCLDTSFVLALFEQRDVWHQEATQIHAALRDHDTLILTPDCVVNEVLSIVARRCLQRRESKAFAGLAQCVVDAIPKDAITWLSPHLPRWFSGCVETMQGAAGALSFHDALLCVAADELGFRAIVSFDEDFDRLGGLQRLGSADAVTTWLEARSRQAP